MKYQIGDFRLDPQTNIVSGPNGEQAVRPKTLQLLLFFIENSDNIHSKQTLLDEVWASAGAQEHVLFQSINEIRGFF